MIRSIPQASPIHSSPFMLVPTFPKFTVVLVSILLLRQVSASSQVCDSVNSCNDATFTCATGDVFAFCNLLIPGDVCEVHCTHPQTCRRTTIIAESGSTVELHCDGDLNIFLSAPHLPQGISLVPMSKPLRAAPTSHDFATVWNRASNPVMSARNTNSFWLILIRSNSTCTSRCAGRYSCFFRADLPGPDSVNSVVTPAPGCVTTECSDSCTNTLMSESIPVLHAVSKFYEPETFAESSQVVTMGYVLSQLDIDNLIIVPRGFHMVFTS